MRGPQSVLVLLLIIPFIVYSQDLPQEGSDGAALPRRLFSRVQKKVSALNDQLTRQSDRFLRRMQRREQQMYRKLYGIDSTAATNLYGRAGLTYEAWREKLSHDTGGAVLHLAGNYQPHTDSLQALLKFANGMNGPLSSEASGALSQLKTLEARMQDADQIKAYVRQRKQAITQYLQEHAEAAGVLGKDVRAVNTEIYYYAERIRGYKAMLNDPDKLEKEALALLNKLPAFQAFMKQNSQLAGLFNLPGNYGDPSTLAGLQTRDQVAGMIAQRVSSMGTAGPGALQANLQSAQSQLGGYKEKLSKLGEGGGDIDMPDFKPNNEKTKTFWRRLEYGTNLQTTRNSAYFPATTDFGVSVGYKLNDKNVIGVGASYKLGWGNGIQHIAFSSQGAGLRSFIDIHVNGSFSATGGFEYNYTQPFNSYQQLRQIDWWTKSGLIGISKTVSLKSRVFKKTKVQLLWDFLSYQQMPRTQPILFRVGYDF